MDSTAERVSLRDGDGDHDPGRRILLGVVVGVYLLGLGALVGTGIERIRFNYRRDAVLARHDHLLRARNTTLMNIERGIAHGSRTTSTEPDAVDTMRQD
jgi:hypothetical protein